MGLAARARAAAATIIILVEFVAPTCGSSEAAQLLQADERLPLIPYPTKVKGSLVWQPLSEDVVLEVGPGLHGDHAVSSLSSFLGSTSEQDQVSLLDVHSASRVIRRHGQKVGARHKVGATPIQVVSLHLDQDKAFGDNDESYSLRIGDGKAVITAANETGIFYAVQTLKQLVASRSPKALPQVSIEDSPRFHWRGLMLDSSRHFFTAENVKSMLETMASFKLNRFHWHLTDDQGWRIPIDGWPALTEIGANGVTKGSYTKEQIQDVVAFAKARHIEVVPEIDVPGHVQAAVAAYPDLGNTDVRGWRKPSGPSKEWGVHEYTLAPNEKVMGFLESVFSTLHELFPGPFVHVGGDEVNTRQWRMSHAAGTSALQVHTTAATLQSYFNGRLADLLKQKGKKAIGWDESQHIGGLPSDTTIMAWRSADEARLGVRNGRDVINADSEVYYFDRYQGPQSTEPKAICCHVPLAQVWNHDPIPSGLTEQEATHIKGGQGQLWSEYLPNWKQVEYMANPRSMALAEKLWSSRDGLTNYADFIARLQVRLNDLDARGVNYRTLNLNGE